MLLESVVSIVGASRMPSTVTLPVTLMLPVPVISCELRSKSPPSCGVVSSTTLPRPPVEIVLHSALPAALTVSTWLVVPSVAGSSVLPLAFSMSFRTRRSFSTVTSELNVTLGTTVIPLESVVSMIGVNKLVVTVKLLPIVTSSGKPIVAVEPSPGV